MRCGGGGVEVCARKRRPQQRLRGEFSRYKQRRRTTTARKTVAPTTRPITVARKVLSCSGFGVLIVKDWRLVSCCVSSASSGAMVFLYVGFVGI